ncbi:D-2-hydroxyacid dehydrogenase [Ornatilinea apprima]|uniref:D-2-hydroxyacid dehydrogenase n=1 Tax=Ornatilinea apprima TaxID=1134406 RepID=UPI00094668E5|nr:D-2-hydroxyacid dehydrogenase [Ornatilinea apprima]
MADGSKIEVLITKDWPETLVERIRAVSPRLNVRVAPVKKAEDLPADALAQCEVFYTDMHFPQPDAMPSLRWLQLHWAGIEYALEYPLLTKADLAVTTMSGAAMGQLAEFALAMMLALGHRLPALVENQTAADWPVDRLKRYVPQELRGSTVGIIGYGSIGRELARLLQPFDVTVLAAKRDVMHPEDRGYTPPGLGDPEGNLFRRLYPVEARGSMIKECDFVVVTVPLTPQTRGLIGKREFELMKPNAYLIDISRGGVVDEAALVDALTTKKIAGAALDVFATEPLPKNHVFWKLPNMLVTPHIAISSVHYDRLAAELFMVNLERYLSGLPLYNQFDFDKGY